MARKKKPASGEASQDQKSAPSSSSTANGSTRAPLIDPAPSNSLVISRNKHWRYISCFHGPWLQLPPEMLESLAHNNYISPRPHPIDPAVFYDLVKIRKAVDEATSLAVRASSGLTSAALSNSVNAGNGMLGSAGVAALGLGYGNMGTGKLSRERKFRMRELATQKLSAAYQLDEIATSVATMQSTSTLEDVAQLVLQRNGGDSDAKYVHFFHEKIPSRMMAQCTSLNPLDDIIAERSTSGSTHRTRALTRLFKEDYAGAARDLTEGLSACRFAAAQHRAGKDQLVLTNNTQDEGERKTNRDWRQEIKIEEEDQPTGLEAQLLFHRAGAYFTIACRHVLEALEAFREETQLRKNREDGASMAKSIFGEHSAVAAADSTDTTLEEFEPSPGEQEAHRRHLEARKQVKTNAKRALRDYTSFISNFDYTPPIPLAVAEEFLQRVENAANGSHDHTKYTSNRRRQLLDSTTTTSTLPNGTSSALVPHTNLTHSSTQTNGTGWPTLPPPEIYPLSTLFASTPPASLPKYPEETADLTRLYDNKSNGWSSSAQASQSIATFAANHEVVTYHPLLTEALHSILLLHALLQTSPKEVLRHANNVARLVRVCDGYPIFLAARSPARADWIEIIRRTANWIGLSQTWESLCRPAPLPGQKDEGERKNETPEQKRERLKHEAILEALADERVVDEESFQRAVRARERRAMEDEMLAEQQVNGSRSSSNGTSPSTPRTGAKRWAHEEREYPISTERAEAITRWIKEAPLTVEGAKRKKSSKTKAKARKPGEGDTPSLQNGVSGLSMNDVPEEEIDE